MEVLGVVLYCLMVFFLLIGFISVWLSGSITGAYFDEKLQERGLPLLDIFAAGFSRRCVRASTYLLLILFNGNPLINRKCKWYPKFFIKRYERVFGKTDFRELARKRDWILAIIIWGNFLLFDLSIVMVCLLAAYLHFTGVL